MDFNELNQGSNIYRLAEELNWQERKIMDFNTPSNPLGVSKKIKAELRRHLKYLNAYPDPDAKRLRKRLGQYHGIDPEMILCGNGSTEFLYALILTLQPRKVFVVEPADPRHKKICGSCGLQVAGSELRKKDDFGFDVDGFISSFINHSSSLIVVNNPDFLTGRLLKKEDVIRIADAAKASKCYLVVDEALIDFCPDNSTVNEVSGNPYLIVLRSMSFFYALAGLRMGYGVFHQDIADSIRRCGELGIVNSLAQRAAVIALKDGFYVKETFKAVLQEKKFLEKGFKKLGIDFFPSETNFYLVKMDKAEEVYRQLKRKGLLLGDCSNIQGLDNTYLRIALKSHRANAVLLRELTGILQK
jgi:threonine-phosphate decarboxylase